jgi:probable addiction module antidote protein
MNKKAKFSRFDAADYLFSEQDMTDYLDACSEGPAVLIQALATVARARNMTALAHDAGLTRPGLYRALAPDGNPSFANVQAIAKSLGLKITFSVASPVA